MSPQPSQTIFRSASSRSFTSALPLLFGLAFLVTVPRSTFRVPVGFVEPVIAQSTALSPAARAILLEKFTTDDVPGVPPGYLGRGGHRFATNRITVSFEQPTSRQAINGRKAIRFWTEFLRLRGVALTFVEVAPSQPADYRFTYEAAIRMPDGSLLTNFCGYPGYEVAADRVTMITAYVMSNQNKYGCDGTQLLLHEMQHNLGWLGHGFTYGIGAKNFDATTVCIRYDETLTPEQNARRIGWEGHAGYGEAMAWVWSNPPGALPH